jgi:hypothetical protein
MSGAPDDRRRQLPPAPSSDAWASAPLTVVASMVAAEKQFGASAVPLTAAARR